MKKLLSPLFAIITFTAISVNANAIELGNNLSTNKNATPMVEMYDLNSEQIERFSAARKFYKELLEKLEVKHNEVIESILSDTKASH